MYRHAETVFYRIVIYLFPFSLPSGAMLSALSLISLSGSTRYFFAMSQIVSLSSG